MKETTYLQSVLAKLSDVQSKEEVKEIMRTSNLSAEDWLHNEELSSPLSGLDVKYRAEFEKTDDFTVNGLSYESLWKSVNSECPKIPAQLELNDEEKEEIAKIEKGLNADVGTAERDEILVALENNGDTPEMIESMQDTINEKEGQDITEVSNADNLSQGEVSEEYGKTEAGAKSSFNNEVSEYREVTLERAKDLNAVILLNDELETIDNDDYITRSNKLLAINEKQKDISELDTKIRALDSKNADIILDEYNRLTAANNAAIAGLSIPTDKLNMPFLSEIYKIEREANPNLPEIDWNGGKELNEAQRTALLDVAKAHQEQHLERAESLQMAKNAAYKVLDTTKTVANSVGKTMSIQKARATLASVETERKFVNWTKKNMHKAAVVGKQSIYINNPLSKVSFLQTHKSFLYTKVRRLDSAIAKNEKKNQEVYSNAKKKLERQYKWKEVLKKDKTEITPKMVNTFVCENKKSMNKIKTLDIEKAKLVLEKIETTGKINDTSLKQVKHLEEKGLSISQDKINIDNSLASVRNKNVVSISNDWISKGISKDLVTKLNESKAFTKPMVAAINTSLALKISPKDINYMLSAGWKPEQIQDANIIKASETTKNFNFMEVKSCINNNIPTNDIINKSKAVLENKIELNKDSKESNFRYLGALVKALPEKVFKMHQEDEKADDLEEELNDLKTTKKEIIPAYSFEIKSKYIDKESFDKINAMEGVNCIEKGGKITFFTNSLNKARNIYKIKGDNEVLTKNMDVSINTAGTNAMYENAKTVREARDAEKQRLEEVKKHLNDNKMCR